MTFARYLARKRAELALVAEATPPPAPADGTIEALLDAKRLARAGALAARTLTWPELTETNVGRRAIEVGGRMVSWSYQRFDLAITGGGPYVGALAGEAVQHDTVWAGSGMAAIAALVIALDSGGVRRLVTGTDTYFETTWVAERVAGLAVQRLGVSGAVAAPAGPWALWLCSIGHESHLPMLATLASGPRVVVLDTTCYSASGCEVAAVVDACAAAAVPLVLVRSHLKLDGLGVELGRLGSATFVLADRAAPRTRTWALRLLAGHAEALARAGGAVNPLHLPPLSTPTRERAAALRLTALRRANRRAATALATCTNATVRRHHHDLFFTIECGSPRAGQLDVLAAALRRVGVPARRAPSFGLDTTHVDHYVDLARQREVTRFAVSDLPDTLVDRLVEVVAQELAGRVPRPLRRTA